MVFDLDGIVAMDGIDAMAGCRTVDEEEWDSLKERIGTEMTPHHRRAPHYMLPRLQQHMRRAFLAKSRNHLLDMTRIERVQHVRVFAQNERRAPMVGKGLLYKTLTVMEVA